MRFSFRLPLYVSPVPNPSVWAIGALSIPWKGVIGYAFRPLPLVAKVLRKAREDNVCLLFLVPPGPLSHGSPIGCLCTRMVAVWSSLQSLGASGQTISLVEEAHRPGTRSVYSFHWERWISWCHTSGVDPLHPTSVQLANFLAHLSSNLYLSALSVKVYRAAVCSTLRQMGGLSFSDDPLLRDVVRRVSLTEARV